MIRICLLFSLLLPSLVFAQKRERLQPDKLYDAGATLFAPRVGFTSAVPVGWTGLLPREGEVFLLNSITKPLEIFIFVRENSSLEAIRKDWGKEYQMDANISLKAVSPTIKDNMLTSEVDAVGPFIDKGKKGYAVARCGGFGPCVIAIASMQSVDFEEGKKVVESVMRSAKFEAPSQASAYSDFDWNKFVTGKMFTTYIYKDKGSKETKIDFCSDGTFKGKVSKSGFMKNQNPEFKGKISGTWKVEGIGETGKLILSSKDKGSFEVTLKIQDDKVFANEERYFVAASEQCK